MHRSICTAALVLSAYCVGNVARGDFVVQLRHSDFGIVSNFNQVAEFSFDILLDGDLTPGGTYGVADIKSIDYRIRGVLPSPTPSGFPGFLLIRSITGAEFATLSPDASLSFSVDPTADLSDGVQVSELSGSDPVLFLNARELNQEPGRYHPPILSLNANGTGQLRNANNASTFNNPPPPMGSGLPVNVAIGQEYDVGLTFSQNLTIATSVPEPSTLMATALLVVICWSRNRLRRPVLA